MASLREVICFCNEVYCFVISNVLVDVLVKLSIKSGVKLKHAGPVQLIPHCE